MSKNSEKTRLFNDNFGALYHVIFGFTGLADSFFKQNVTELNSGKRRGVIPESYFVRSDSRCNLPDTIAYRKTPMARRNIS